MPENKNATQFPMNIQLIYTTSTLPVVAVAYR